MIQRSQESSIWYKNFCVFIRIEFILPRLNEVWSLLLTNILNLSLDIAMNNPWWKDPAARN